MTEVSTRGRAPACDVPPASSAAGDTEGEGLLLTDLLLDLDSAAALLEGRCREGDWLDGYLLSCGAAQILGDALAGRAGPGGRAWWRKLAVEYAGPSRRRRLFDLVVGAGVGLADRFCVRTQRHVGVRRCRDAVADLRAVLAPVVAGGQAPCAAEAEAACDLAAQVRVRSGRLPASVRAARLRLPSCFRSFDQRPEDVVELVRRYAARHPRRDRPVLVVGVRTSGSYLAPLGAAALRQLGYERVSLLDLRPAFGVPVEDRRHLAALGSEGHVLMFDDPPSSGRSILQVAQAIEGLGVSPERTFLMLALTGGGSLPPMLEAYPSVVLPWPEWDIHRLLAPDRVGQALSAVEGRGRRLASCVRREGLPAPARGHLLARFDVEWRDGGGGVARESVAVEGVGLGCFGRHAVAVGMALAGRVAPVRWFADGLLFRDWVEGDGPGGLDDPAAVDAAARYVVDRHRALPVERDPAAALVGQLPVWEAAAMLLSRPLGRSAPLGRSLLVGPAVRSLLAVERPSVVDGRMESDRWLHAVDGWKKLAPATGAFSHLDLMCYDPIWDLAAAGVEVELAGGRDDSSAALRAQFEAETGSGVDDERWLVYQLVHLWDLDRRGGAATEVVERAASRAVARYLGSVFCTDLPARAEGPLCALDLDGTLESAGFGFPATTAVGALSIRALRAHGYRPVVATGRSIGEVADRCRAFGLAGGIGEYGTALYCAAEDAVEDLRDDEERAGAAAIRSFLAAEDGLVADDAFGHAVRVYQGASGRGRTVPAARLAAACVGGPAWQVVVGENQTDLVPSGHDKRSALVTLSERLGVPRGVPLLALAVGDTASDLTMLQSAMIGCSPANGSSDLPRAGIPVLRGAYQEGVAEAVERLIGHRPGGCPRCAARPPAPRTRLLVALLSTDPTGHRAVRSVLGAVSGFAARSWSR